MAFPRRYFAITGCAAAVALRLQPTLPAVGARSLLDRLFSDPAAARNVGRRVLLAMPETAETAMALARELSAATGSATHALGRALTKRIEGDYRDGKVVIVAGWIIARNEALACAATALAEDGYC